MKSNLLKVFCGMMFAVFAQANVEGMNPEELTDNELYTASFYADVLNGSDKITNEAADLNEEIHKDEHLHLREFVCSIITEIDGKYDMETNIKEGTINGMKESISEIIKKYPKLEQRYPYIFGLGPNSLLYFFNNCYTAEYAGGVLTIVAKSDRGIRQNYAKMKYDGVEWRRLYECWRSAFRFRKKRK